MDYAEAYDGYAAQGILRMDAEIVKKSHLWMETNLWFLMQPFDFVQVRFRIFGYIKFIECFGSGNH